MCRATDILSRNESSEIEIMCRQRYERKSLPGELVLRADGSHTPRAGVEWQAASASACVIAALLRSPSHGR